MDARWELAITDEVVKITMKDALEEKRGRVGVYKKQPMSPEDQEMIDDR